MTNTDEQKNYDPLRDSVTLETRSNAAGLAGKKGMDDPDWEKIVKKRPHVKTVKGQAFDLSNQNAGFGAIHVNLEWSEPKPVGFLEKVKSAIGFGKGIDLDLGCLYELTDGTRGVIQAFGEVFGNYNEAPYLHLKGDDRTGVTTGEDIYLNGDKWDNIRRVVFYAYIYEGVACWSNTDAILTVFMKDQDPLDVRLQEYEDGLPVCALVKFENVRGQIQVTNLNEYFPGHAEMERAFGFGLNWEEGSKDDK